MYRESIQKNILPVFFKWIMFIYIAIIISQSLEKYKIDGYKIGNYSYLFCIVILSIVTVKQIINYKTSYKYLVIADELIIHKVLGNKQYTQECIKIDSICFIGKYENVRKKISVKRTKQYVCSIFTKDKYCCIYKKGNIYNKFYFQSSCNFINKITHIKNNIDLNK